MVDVINEAYAIAEQGLWKDSNRKRIDFDRMEADVKKDMFIVLLNQNNDILGCIGYMSDGRSA